MIELLSPAGSIDGLRLAIAAGADAVYIGAPSFNARQKAVGFDDIREAVEYCHLFGVKCYIAMNIALKDAELDQAAKVVEQCLSAGVDAFIIADLALFNIIKKMSTKTRIHASTQMGIHNLEGALYLEGLGFDRIILSRETKLDDIKSIKQNTNLEIEVFAHGALCVAFSGACLMSAIRSGNSANRGRCLQPCRQQYESFDNGGKTNSGYLLSAADLYSGQDIAALIGTGVDSLKIEGRLRRPEYTYIVTNEYKKAILDSKYSIDLDKIKSIYNRGNFTRGYNFSENIIYPLTPGHIGINAGKVTSIQKDGCTIQAKMQLEKGDSFKILDSTGIEKGSAIFSSHIKENEYKLAYKGGIEIGNCAHLTTDNSLLNKISAYQPKLPLQINIEGDTVSFSARGQNVECKLSTTPNLRELTSEEVAFQLSKVGGTCFEIEKINKNCTSVQMKKSELNKLRRTLIQELTSKILLNYKQYESKNELVIQNALNESYLQANLLLADEENITQLAKATARDWQLVYAPTDYRNAFSPLLDRDLYLYLPILAYGEDINLYKSILAKGIYKGIVCGNYYGAQLAKEFYLPFIASYNLNITNKANPMTTLANGYVISLELESQEIKDTFINGHIYAYGYIPLMSIAHNLEKVAKANGGSIVYKDRKFGYNIAKVQAISKHYVIKNPFLLDILDKVEGYPTLVDCRGLGIKELGRILGKGEVKKDSTLGLFARGVK